MQAETDVIGVVEAARTTGVRPRVLMRLEAAGLVSPERLGTERRYSARDLETLARCATMIRELGVNLAGVEVALHLLRRVEALQAQLTRHGRYRVTPTFLPEDPSGDGPDA